MNTQERPMKSINIFYFSGTGNTKYIVENMTEEFAKMNVNPMCVSIEEYTEQSHVKEDIIGIAYPIYGLGTPRIVKEWSEKLPMGKGKKVFIINTAADFLSINTNATNEVINILEAKGYEVFYDRIVVMPSNWLLGYDPSLSKQLIEVSKLKVKDICDDIVSETIRKHKPNILVKAVGNFVHYGESNFGARQFGKSLVTTEGCNQCGHCISMCPVKNITMTNGKLEFGSKCIFCMRCVYRCPMKAITSKGLSFCIIKEGYNLEKIINNDEIEPNYVTENTRGYYKHFYKYMKNIKL